MDSVYLVLNAEPTLSCGSERAPSSRDLSASWRKRPEASLQIPVSKRRVTGPTPPAGQRGTRGHRRRFRGPGKKEGRGLVPSHASPTRAGRAPPRKESEAALQFPDQDGMPLGE